MFSTRPVCSLQWRRLATCDYDSALVLSQYADLAAYAPSMGLTAYLPAPADTLMPISHCSRQAESGLSLSTGTSIYPLHCPASCSKIVSLLQKQEVEQMGMHISPPKRNCKRGRPPKSTHMQESSPAHGVEATNAGLALDESGAEPSHGSHSPEIAQFPVAEAQSPSHGQVSTAAHGFTCCTVPVMHS